MSVFKKIKFAILTETNNPNCLVEKIKPHNLRNILYKNKYTLPKTFNVYGSRDSNYLTAAFLNGLPEQLQNMYRTDAARFRRTLKKYYTTD
jgi:hypothetical protein